jgi:predicted O-methyltransferase YrrM
MNKNPSPATLEKFIAELYARGVAQGEDGTEFKILPMSLTPERGAFLRDMCRAQRPGSTIEIGMAYGLSTLLIVQTLLEGGAASCAHTVLDPFQTSTFHDAGRRAIREAGVERMIDFHHYASEYLLPRMLQEGRRFDFAFIDGDHRFDHVFVDLFYIHRLLKPSGVLVLDDCFSDSVHYACRFLQTNYGYSVLAQYPGGGSRLDDQASPPEWRPMMRAMRKPVEEAPNGRFHFVPFFPLVAPAGPPPEHPAKDKRVEASVKKPSPAATANRLRHDALAALQGGNRSAARAGFVGALRLEPFHLKTYLRMVRTFFPPSVIRLFSSPARRREASRRE